MQAIQNNVERETRAKLCALNRSSVAHSKSSVNGGYKSNNKSDTNRLKDLKNPLLDSNIEQGSGSGSGSGSGASRYGSI